MALEISLIWGIMSLVVIYLVKPIIDKIIKKIPSGKHHHLVLSNKSCYSMSNLLSNYDFVNFVA